jgi:hypothetical protein
MIQPTWKIIPADGRPVCRHGYNFHDDDDICGKPAVWHVRWRKEANGTNATGMQCQEHMDLIQRNWVYMDRHRIMANCPMPGMWWWVTHCDMPPSEALTATVREEISV